LASSIHERRSPSRRFLPPDPKVHEPYRLTPQLALRVGILGALALGVFGLLFFRLWSLQVLSGDTYLAAAQNNQIRTIRVEAPRGAILDRNGDPIVSNVPGTAVQIWVSDLPKQGRYRMLRRLAQVLHVPLGRLVREVEQAKGDPLTPITVKTAVHEPQVYYLSEHQTEFRGVRITGTYLRGYEHQSMAAHILGYVREISPEELKAKRADGYRAGDKIGKAGIEAAFDQYLRGRSGLAQIRVNSLGIPQSGLEPREDAHPGRAVKLTLDSGLQRAAERALREGIRIARANKAYNAAGGAIVALDPRDGAIRAIASNPTYKPSIYVGRIDPDKLKPLLDPVVAKQQNYRGLNRAIEGVYPAGSTSSRSRTGTRSRTRRWTCGRRWPSRATPTSTTSATATTSAGRRGGPGCRTGRGSSVSGSSRGSTSAATRPACSRLRPGGRRPSTPRSTAPGTRAT
jgi:penicillin-binding protein 2